MMNKFSMYMLKFMILREFCNNYFSKIALGIVECSVRVKMTFLNSCYNDSLVVVAVNV